MLNRIYIKEKPKNVSQNYIVNSEPERTPPTTSCFTRFFCCCSQPAQNPVPHTTHMMGLTDENGNTLINENSGKGQAFLVVKATKNWKGNYGAEICYVNAQAEAMLKSNKLVGKDISTLIPDADFRKKHSVLMSGFFSTLLKTGVNPSRFIGQHITRALETLLPGDKKTVVLDFMLNHTIARASIKDKPVVYIVAQLGQHKELTKANSSILTTNLSPNSPKSTP